MSRGTFFFFYLFIYLFIFAFYFSKCLKFDLGLPKWKFSTPFHDGEKKLGKMTLPPQKMFPVTPLHATKILLTLLTFIAMGGGGGLLKYQVIIDDLSLVLV